MPRRRVRSPADEAIRHMQELQESIHIVSVDLSDERGQTFLRDYIREHRKVEREDSGADEAARGNFNEYLQRKLGIPDNKIAVAEIKGGGAPLTFLGTPKRDGKYGGNLLQNN